MERIAVGQHFYSQDPRAGSDDVLSCICVSDVDRPVFYNISTTRCFVAPTGWPNFDECLVGDSMPNQRIQAAAAFAMCQAGELPIETLE